jgi:hypothetical protein
MVFIAESYISNDVSGETLRQPSESKSVNKLNDPEGGGCILSRNFENSLSGHTALHTLKRLISSSVFYILVWCKGARVTQK